MKGLTRILLLIALLGASAPAEVLGQATGKLAIGMSLSSKMASDSEARGTPGIGFLYRLGHGRPGWGWKYGLNWYSAELDRPIGNGSEAFGKLRIRPLLGGYGYTHIIGRTKIGANLKAGYAFTSFNVHDSFDRAYRANRGVESIDTSSSNTFVLKPEVSVWHDVSEKIGFNFNAGYVIARPEVTVISSLGRDQRRVRADMLSVKAGLVYSVSIR